MKECMQIEIGIPWFCERGVRREYLRGRGDYYEYVL